MCSTRTLKEGITKGKIICFADHILIICDNIYETKAYLKAMEELGDVGLCLNKSKTKIICDHADLKDL